MEFKPLDIRVWSKMGQRAAFGSILTRLANENDQVIALTADLTSAAGLEPFKEHFAERFLNVGIAEQNLIGVAAGIADSGSIPFATTFANFISLRACEQVRHFLGYMNCNVKLVGLSAGFGMELFGNTHYGLEDIACIRSIPNLVILSPADGLEIFKCVEAAVNYEGPVYIRLTGILNQPYLYKQDYEFQIGRAVELYSSGADVVIYSTGNVSIAAKQAAVLLEQENVECTVINMHTIKPIDRDIIQKHRKVKLIVTIEEHCVTGGLGSAVAEILSEYSEHAPLLKIGSGHSYEKAGSYEYMLKQHGLTAECIVDKIRNNLSTIK